jgi:hypothetical protein
MKRIAAAAWVPARWREGGDALDRMLGLVLRRAKAFASASLWLAFATPAHGAPQPLPPANTEAPDTEPAVASPWPDDADGRDVRRTLLQLAESALSQGRTDAANEAFDRAALMLHASDTEMGQVRAAMQAGEYRRALAFAAHTAGGHGESPAAAVQYAWLLRVGGQTTIANRILAQAQANFPADEVVAEGAEAFRSAVPVADGHLLEVPHRMAPESWTVAASAAPAPGRVVASGVLIDGGAAALVPSAWLPSPPDGRLFVRNGMGQTVAARLDPDRPVSAQGVIRLRLDTALPYRPGDAPAPRDPFPGSPAFVIEYPVTETAAPAWPWLRQGFLGQMSAAGARRLGIDDAAGLHGGVVLDAGGRVAGIAVPGEAGVAWLLPASAWRSAAAAETAITEPIRRPLPLPLDEAYERALRVTLQVIVER